MDKGSFTVQEIVENGDGTCTLVYDIDLEYMKATVLKLVGNNLELQKEIFSNYLRDALIEAAKSEGVEV